MVLFSIAAKSWIKTMPTQTYYKMSN